jgi:hypothetical protein
MRGRERSSSDAVDLCSHTGLDLPVFVGKLRRHAAAAGKESLSELLHPGGGPVGADDNERRASLAPQHRIHEQKGNACTVVTVHVRQKDRLDAVRIDPLCLHGDQRRGTAIEKESPATDIAEDAGLEPAAATEGVSGADEPDLGVHAIARSKS